MSPVGKKANIGIYIVLIVSDRFHKTGFGLPLICKLEVAVRTHHLAKTTHAIYFPRRVHHAFTWVYKRIAALVLFAANGEMRFSLLQQSITHSFHQLFSLNCINKTVTVLRCTEYQVLEGDVRLRKHTISGILHLFKRLCRHKSNTVLPCCLLPFGDKVYLFRIYLCHATLCLGSCLPIS